jgi:hypothetical protein
VLRLLLCKLLGHKVSGRLVLPDGRTTLWCQRERKQIVQFPGWEAINRGSDT